MKKLVVSLCALVLLAGCGSSSSEKEILKVGASPSPHAQILEFIKPQLEAEGITLEVTTFTDYVTPNTALNEGSIDANYFQHLPYLEDFNVQHKMELKSVIAVHFEPLGIYSNDGANGKTKLTLDDVDEGAKIAVPNDSTNEERALLLLEGQGIIKLDKSKGVSSTKADIIENPKNVEIVELEAASVPGALPDVQYAVINGNYALDNNVDKKVIVTEGKEDEGAKKYANIIAVKAGSEDNERIKKLIKVLTSDETKAYIEKTFNGLVVPVF